MSDISKIIVNNIEHNIVDALAQERIDNLITSGDVLGEETAIQRELGDIRAAFDGMSYTSAGNAVRGQASQLNAKINDVKSEIADVKSEVAGLKENGIGGSGATTEQIQQIETNKNNIEKLSQEIDEISEDIRKTNYLEGTFNIVDGVVGNNIETETDKVYSKTDNFVYLHEGSKIRFKIRNGVNYRAIVYLYKYKDVSSFISESGTILVGDNGDDVVYIMPSSAYIRIRLFRRGYADKDSDFDKDISKLISCTYGLYEKETYQTLVNSMHTECDIRFALHTDTHFGYAGGQKCQILRAMNMNNLSRFVKLDFCTNLGDLVNGHASLPFTKNEITEILSVYNDVNSEFLQLVGNHDDNGWYTNSISQRKTLDEVFLKNDWYETVINNYCSNKIAKMVGERYYSYDIPHSRTRVICLDTLDVNYDLKNASGQPANYGMWTYVVSQKQINWLVDCLTFKSTDFENVIILSHHSLACGSEFGNENIINGNIVRGILEAYKNGTIYTGVGTDSNYPITISCDFTNQGVKNIIGNFAGHSHKDDYHVINGINYIQTDNAGYFDGSDDATRKYEDVLDVVSVSLKKKTISINRLGYGDDRNYSF